MSEWEIRVVPYADPVAQALMRDALADLVARYGGDGDSTPMAAAEFEPPAGGFLVGFLDGVPVGSAAWRSRTDDPTVAELKRMYTVPAARGRGVGRRLLAAVEESARSAGRKRLVLECGDRQPEAIGLYHACGYERIEDFGYYRGHPGVLSFGLDL